MFKQPLSFLMVQVGHRVIAWCHPWGLSPPTLTSFLDLHREFPSIFISVALSKKIKLLSRIFTYKAEWKSATVVQLETGPEPLPLSTLSHTCHLLKSSGCFCGATGLPGTEAKTMGCVDCVEELEFLLHTCLHYLDLYFRKWLLIMIFNSPTFWFIKDTYLLLKVYKTERNCKHLLAVILPQPERIMFPYWSILPPPHPWRDFFAYLWKLDFDLLLNMIMNFHKKNWMQKWE